MQPASYKPLPLKMVLIGTIRGNIVYKWNAVDMDSFKGKTYWRIIRLLDKIYLS